MQNVTFRAHSFHPPTNAPFDQNDCWWPTVVGNFFRQIVTDPEVEPYVFLDHRGGPQNDIELRFASDDYVRIEQEMTILMGNLGIQHKGQPAGGQTLGQHAYHGTRWISAARSQIAADANRRSELVMRFLHAGCALYLDNLLPDGPRWRIEDNTDQENPLHNLFESQLHLISNFSQTRFNVYMAQNATGLAAATDWMLSQANQPLAKIGVCHLEDLNFPSQVIVASKKA